MESKQVAPEQDAGDLSEETFTPHDVVLGKGNGINCLPGNIKFRQIIARYKPLYAATPRSVKGSVAELVIEEIALLDPPGRFLEPQADRRFKQVSRKRAVEKTCQALREKKNKGTAGVSATLNLAHLLPQAQSLLPQVKQAKLMMAAKEAEQLHTPNPTAHLVQQPQLPQVATGAVAAPMFVNTPVKMDMDNPIPESQDKSAAKPMDVVEQKAEVDDATVPLKPPPPVPAAPSVVPASSPQEQGQQTAATTTTGTATPSGFAGVASAPAPPATAAQEKSVGEEPKVKAETTPTSVAAGESGVASTAVAALPPSTAAAVDEQGPASTVVKFVGGLVDSQTAAAPSLVTDIKENDVLYGGRGRKHFHRVANQRFLDLIKYCRQDYQDSRSKKAVAIRIINQWRSQNPPGRFLQQDSKSEQWFEIPDAKILEKTCQALRDLKRERGPGGVRPTIADRMVDPRIAQTHPRNVAVGQATLVKGRNDVAEGKVKRDVPPPANSMNGSVLPMEQPGGKSAPHAQVQRNTAPPGSTTATVPNQPTVVSTTTQASSTLVVSSQPTLGGDNDVLMADAKGTSTVATTTPPQQAGSVSQIPTRHEVNEDRKGGEEKDTNVPPAKNAGPPGAGEPQVDRVESDTTSKENETPSEEEKKSDDTKTKTALPKEGTVLSSSPSEVKGSLTPKSSEKANPPETSSKDESQKTATSAGDKQSTDQSKTQNPSGKANTGDTPKGGTKGGDSKNDDDGRAKGELEAATLLVSMFGT